MDFQKKLPFKSYGVKSQYANEYLLTETSYGTDAVTFHIIDSPSLVLSKSNVQLHASKAASYWNRSFSDYSRIGLHILLCSLPYTFRYILLTFALCKSLAPAQQRFSFCHCSKPPTELIAFVCYLIFN